MGYKVIFSKTPDILICGSILGFNKYISKNTKIWGVGFHFNEEKSILQNQNLFYAVRGKLTLDKLNLNSNIALGDPGLLLSFFFKPKTQKKYDICIISHYIDYQFFIENYGNKYFIINMGTNNIEKIANSINKCNFIFSSSLHGIIFSHSLGIPAMHIEYNKLASKNNFKFKDYYSILDIPYIKENITKNNLDSIIKKYKRNKSKLLLPSYEIVKQIQHSLLFSFPFQKINNAICTIINNINKDINEWCNYHLKLGFDHIFIFNNISKYNDYIGNLIDNKLNKKVHILSIYNKRVSKNKLFNNFYNKFKLNFNWCAFFNLNEFIVLYKWRNITQFLNQNAFKNVFLIKLKKNIFRNNILIKRAYRQLKYKKQINISFTKHDRLIIKGGLLNFSISLNIPNF